MLCLSVACLFFKSYNLQYRQQCIFWELIFPKSHNPESKLHKKWKLRFFHQKGNLMLCNLEEKHKTEIYPKYSKDNLLTQLLQFSKHHAFLRNFDLLLEIYIKDALQKASEETFLYRAFAGFVYRLGMLQWKRRFDPCLAARW